MEDLDEAGPRRDRPGRFGQFFGPLTPGRLAVLLAAVAFLGGSIGYFVRDRESQARSQADVGFLQDMIVHHDQAVQIARLALFRDLPVGVRSYADEIVLTQQFQSGEMSATLSRWNEPVEGDGTAMDWMGMAVPSSQMPGLASTAELSRLDRSDGTEAGALFFAMMSRHHLGGVHMAEAAADRAKDPWVRQLATNLAQSQRFEIREYAAARQRLGLPVPAGYAATPRIDLPRAERGSDSGPPSSLTLVLVVVLGLGLVLAAARIRRSRQEAQELAEPARRRVDTGSS